jgi:hypothetical protein
MRNLDISNGTQIFPALHIKDENLMSTLRRNEEAATPLIDAQVVELPV